MTWKRASALWALLLTTTFMLGFAGSAWASHRWGCWKYVDGVISFYNGATNSAAPLDYYNILQEEAKSDNDSWEPTTDVTLTPVGSSGKTDHMNVYASTYGFNNWLGIAEIRRWSGCTVKEGRVRINRSWMDGSSYTRTNREHVACQEVGHLLGLNHQYSNNTCMNDSILTQPQPDQHDRDLVNSIY